jgi:hypothetical protein
MRYEEHAVDKRCQRDEVEGDCVSNGCADESQANGFWAPY